MDSRSFLEQKGVPFPGLFGRIQMMPCAIKDCAGFVVNSNTLKAVCDEYSPTVIRNGYDVDEFAVPKASKKSLRKRLGLPQGKTLMLFTGKIVAWKNLELVFELLKESRDLFLVVLGEAADRSYCNMLKSKYSSLAGQFAFHPEVNMDEVRLYLHACDIFVFPSIKEGSPNSVLEAMAAGMPVVCSSIPAHREIIQSAHNGFTFGNIRELRRIVNRLAHDTELRNQVGGAAKEYAKSNHNIATIADQYVRLYSSKLDGKKVATC
jgi:glycosyltransferase involved in cell wall biosynthesis